MTRRRRLLLFPPLALALATLIGLGVWQLARFQRARGLEADRAAAIAAAPLPLGGGQALPAALDYRRVAIDGRWDGARLFTVANRVRFDVLGEEAVVPLLPADGGPALLVDRGWYPLSERDRVLSRLASDPGGRVEGLARAAAGSAHATASGAWTGFDPRAMAAALPYPAVAGWGVIEGPLLAEEPLVPPAALPAQGYFAYHHTTPHLEYALTWFGLAGALVVTAYLRLARRGRAGARPATPVPPPPDG